MDKVIKIINKKKTSLPVYTENEAKEQGLEYKYWKDCSDGEYGLSDDGYVSECIYRRSYKKSKHDYINFAFGVSWVNKYSRIKYEENKAYRTFGMVKPSTWQDREAKTPRTKNAVQAYVTQLMSSEPVDWDAIGKIYRSDQKVPAATVRRLFKEEKIRAMVDKKIEEILLDKGITKDLVCDINLQALKIAKDRKDPSMMHRIGETFAKWVGMDPGKKIITERLEMDMTSQIEETIGKETEKRKVAIERKSEGSEAE
tara:strand:- start:1055 stop:1822 length:768 start_codon:yes stop_codon:yes gene_type:complete